MGLVNSAWDPLVCTVHTEKSTIMASKKKTQKTQKMQTQLINVESKHHLKGLVMRFTLLIIKKV